MLLEYQAKIAKLCEMISSPILDSFKNIIFNEVGKPDSREEQVEK